MTNQVLEILVIFNKNQDEMNHQSESEEAPFQSSDFVYFHDRRIIRENIHRPPDF